MCGFPASGKALKVVSGGIACGPVLDVTYFIVPEELPFDSFIHEDGGEVAQPHANE